MNELQGFIKVNLPINEDAFVSGNGEGVWVEVTPEIEKLYNEDYDGGEFKGLIANDSMYYSSLTCGNEITFTMRGQNRPVAIYDGFLSELKVITEDEKAELFAKIQGYQNNLQ